MKPLQILEVRGSTLGSVRCDFLVDSLVASRADELGSFYADVVIWAETRVRVFELVWIYGGVITLSSHFMALVACDYQGRSFTNSHGGELTLPPNLGRTSYNTVKHSKIQ